MIEFYNYVEKITMGMEIANRIDDTHFTGVVRTNPVTMKNSHHVIRLVPMTGIKLFTYSADILFLHNLTGHLPVPGCTNIYR